MKRPSLSAIFKVLNLVALLAILVFLLSVAVNLLVKQNADIDLKTAERLNTASSTKVEVSNKVSSLEIVQTEVLNEIATITVKNNSSKSINSFYLTIGDNETRRIDLAYSEVRTEVSSGGIFDIKLGLREKLGKKGITIQAVFYTDSTGEGEQPFVDEMTGIRRGEKLQFARGLDLLKNSNLSSSSENLEKVAAALPTASEDVNPGFREGLHWGKQRLLQLIKQSNSSSQELGADVTTQNKNLKSRIDQIMSKL